VRLRCAEAMRCRLERDAAGDDQGDLPSGNHGRVTHYEPPGPTSGQKVVDGDMANDRPVQDDGDVLTRPIVGARRITVGLRA